MARSTVQSRVHPGQRETGEARVIEPRAEPAVHTGVTQLTGSRQLRRLVIQGFRSLIIAHVTGHAIGAKAQELANRGALMA